MTNKTTPGPWAAWPIPNDRLKRYAVVCINEQHCPGTGKQVIACGIRTEADANLIAAAPELLKLAKVACDRLRREFLQLAEKYAGTSWENDPVYQNAKKKCEDATLLVDKLIRG